MASSPPAETTPEPDPIDREEVDTKIDHLESSIDSFWEKLGVLISYHLGTLGCILAVAPPAKLPCGKYWRPILLILMVSAAHFIIFFLLVTRLRGKYIKLDWLKGQKMKSLNAAAQDEEQQGVKRVVTDACRFSTAVCRNLMAILGTLFFVAFTVALAGVCWWFACDKQNRGHGP